ncbi:MAG: hypothetical protein K6E93_08140 [Bacteroidales bacterium]|nr:hypothetical protein [Bacteroidales bacterium]
MRRYKNSNAITMELKKSLSDLVFNKGELKQHVYVATKETFELFRTTTREIIDLFKQERQINGKDVRFEFTDRGDFEFEVKFAGDVLIFMMHTNVFEFSRNHEVMKTPYIREDPKRSFCGVIHIYNFLADSFLYQRDNDLGYMIGRVFVNMDKHYFIEGKRELGMLFNNFNTSLITNESVQSIVESAIEYTTNFDLLTPPYDEVKLVSVGEMRTNFNKKSMVTGKRLGFHFQADTD